MFIRPLLIAPVALIPRLKYIGVGLCIILSVASVQTAFPQKYVNYPETFYTTNQGTTTSADEYMSIWYKATPEIKPATLIKKNTADQFEFESLTKKPTYRKYTYTATGDKNIEVYTGIMYFPGWETYIDGKRGEVTYKENGILTAVVPPGSHTLEIKFTDTPLRKVANMTSLLTVIFLGALFVVQYVKGKKFVLL
jgi:hypothetical protein